MLVIPALGMLRQEDGEFQTSLGYITVRPCLRKKKKKTRKKENRLFSLKRDQRKENASFHVLLWVFSFPFLFREQWPVTRSTVLLSPGLGPSLSTPSLYSFSLAAALC
jgi:hypothetical protein